MKKLKVTGCPPLPGAADGEQARASRRLTTAALLAVSVLTPALVGCPGHLENIGFLGDGSVSVYPPPGPTPIYVDAAALPPPVATPPPTPVTSDAGAPTPPAFVPPDDSAFDPATCSQPAEVAKILTQNCAGCHNATMPPAMLDLASMGAKARLINIPAKNMACMGKPLVAMDLSSSVFLDKISGMNCGAQMPKGRPPLSAKLQKCLTDWIKPPAPAAAPVDQRTCAQGAEISAKILVPKCGSCHGNMMPKAGLDLATPGAKARLNVGAKNAMCMGKPLANQAYGSGVIIDKITGAGCGNRMPFNQPPLNDQEIWCMKEWIKAGSGGTFPPQPTVSQPSAMQPQPAPMALACAQPAAIQMLFATRCNVCHGAFMKAGMLDLETGGAAGAKSRLLNQSARFGGSCIGKTLATRDGTGFLFEKLQGPVPLGCGAPMPLSFAPLSADEVNCVKEWMKN